MAFRLLGRKYGVQVAYTPMLSAHRLVEDEQYRREHLRGCPADRPLICHVWANTPKDLQRVAETVKSEDLADAVDLNLGCPQRTAFVGHFGSYLLDERDRPLVLEMIQKASQTNIPITCKIRLLETLDLTILLAKQLQSAGVSAIAVHGRERASWERKGPGARDGPADLEQVRKISEALEIPVILNGNTIDYKDVNRNMPLANGVMSAEGILDMPDIFAERWKGKSYVKVPVLQMDSPECKKLQKKLRKIKTIEKLPKEKWTDRQARRVTRKEKICDQLVSLVCEQRKVAVSELLGRDALDLALEYMDLVDALPPTAQRTVVFHIRRMLRDELERFQLMKELLDTSTTQAVRDILYRIQGYRSNPSSFVHDKERAQAEADALQRKKQQEGARRRFEERMIRKAKREGKNDVLYYVKLGSAIPSRAFVAKLKTMAPEDALRAFKQNHAQHCLSFHIGSCQQGRTCAFMHVDAISSNDFDEREQLAG